MDLHDREDLKESVYRQIKDANKRSAGLCGIYKQNISGEYKEVLKALKILWREKKIIVKDGAQGPLIFLR